MFAELVFSIEVSSRDSCSETSSFNSFDLREGYKLKATFAGRLNHDLLMNDCPTVDNLRNFFLRLPTEMLSCFQKSQEAR